jgi:hypothetical protein
MMCPRRVGKHKRSNGEQQKNDATAGLDTQKPGEWFGQPVDKLLRKPRDLALNLLHFAH